MRADMAVRVGKYRSHDAVASCEDFDARGGHVSLTRRAGRFCKPASPTNPHRS